MRSQLETPTTTAPVAPSPARTGLAISVRTGTGAGRTLLSAFDAALHSAGVADFNLVTLSSVIPAGARIRHVEAPLTGGHGDLLFCVRAEAFADQPGDTAWAGLGWCAEPNGEGLFVEHHGSSEEAVMELIEVSLEDMKRVRGREFGPVQMALASATCVDEPVCSLVLAAYRVSTWEDPADTSRSPERDEMPQPGPAARHNRPPARSGVAGGEKGSVPRSSHGHTVIAGPTSEPPLYDSEVVRSQINGHARPSRLEELDQPEADGQSAGQPAVQRKVRITVQSDVDYTTAKQFYRLYHRAFGPMEHDAAARQVLHEEEFVEEMLDKRVDKYIAWDAEDRAIGMTTLTRDLDTVPWISPAYFRKHYAEQVSRDAIFYFGFALVDPDHQGAEVLGAMIDAMSREVAAHQGVVAWDMCRINDERGFGLTYRQFLESRGFVDVHSIDQQTYYAASYPGVAE
jgi:pyruvoyl-dependent arginine decarboxylase